MFESAVVLAAAFDRALDTKTERVWNKVRLESKPQEECLSVIKQISRVV